jgi:hypothetical protein
MRRPLHRFSLAVLLVILTIGLPTIAQARVDFDIGIGVPGPHYYHPYYGPHYYVPPPVYYYPPPVAYAPPPPIAYAPAPMVVQTPVPPPGARAGQYCREYHGDATIDRRGQPFYGTACMQPDGKWHIGN